MRITGPRRASWTRARTYATASGVTLLWLAVPAVHAQSPASTVERSPDRDVKQIIEAVDQTRDRFEDALDGKLKSSTLRGPHGETNVGAYLDDLQENVKRMKDRFKPDYSGSKEVETVLRQGTDIDAYIKAQPGELKGRSEWERMASELGRLAAAYGTTFPLSANAAVRRINDNEAAATADEVARAADRLKKEIDRDASLVQPTRGAVKQDLDALIKHARTVKSRTSDSRPATAEMREVVMMAGKVGKFVSENTVAPQTRTAWEAVQPPLDKLQQAFGLR
jgi:hypothetical protein